MLKICPSVSGISICYVTELYTTLINALWEIAVTDNIIMPKINFKKE